MAKKTIPVKQLKEEINTTISSLPATKEYDTLRNNYSTIFEFILHKTGNYKGFKYLDIKFNDNNEVVTYGNETRKEYY